MFLYFNKSGVLKEMITDYPLRQYSTNTEKNTVYIYIEDENNLGKIPTTITGLTYWFGLPNGTISTSYTCSRNTSGDWESAKELPFDPNRDLKFFKYGVKYEMFKFVIPSGQPIQTGQSLQFDNNVLEFSGNLGLSIRLVTTTGQQPMLGLVVLKIENSVLMPSDNTSVSQFEYMLGLITSLRSDWTQLIQSGYTQLTYSEIVTNSSVAVNAEFDVDKSKFNRTPLLNEVLNILINKTNTDEVYMATASIKHIYTNLVTVKIKSAKNINGETGAPALVYQDTPTLSTMTVGTQFTITKVNCNRDPLANDTISTLAKLTGSPNIYWVTASIASDYAGGPTATATVTSYQRVIGETPLTYNETFTAQSIAVGTDLNLEKAKFNRTPLASELMVLMVKVSGDTSIYLATVEVYSLYVAASTVPVEVKSIQRLSGELALTYNVIHDTSTASVGDTLTLSKANFNRTPIANDYVLIIIHTTTDDNVKAFTGAISSTYAGEQNVSVTLASAVQIKGDVGPTALTYDVISYTTGPIASEYETTLQVANFNRTPVASEYFQLILVDNSDTYTYMVWAQIDPDYQYVVGQPNVDAIVKSYKKITGPSGTSAVYSCNYIATSNVSSGTNLYIGSEYFQPYPSTGSKLYVYKIYNNTLSVLRCSCTGSQSAGTIYVCYIDEVVPIFNNPLVPSTRTIAGISLENNISANDLKTGIGLTSYVKNVVASDDKVVFTKQDDSTVEFSGGAGTKLATSINDVNGSDALVEFTTALGEANAEITTAAAMTAVITNANIGNVYKYTGPTTTDVPYGNRTLTYTIGKTYKIVNTETYASGGLHSVTPNIISMEGFVASEAAVYNVRKNMNAFVAGGTYTLSNFVLSLGSLSKFADKMNEMLADYRLTHPDAVYVPLMYDNTTSTPDLVMQAYFSQPVGETAVSFDKIMVKVGQSGQIISWIVPVDRDGYHENEFGNTASTVTFANVSFNYFEYWNDTIAAGRRLTGCYDKYGFVKWPTSGGGGSLSAYSATITLDSYANVVRAYNIIHNAKGNVNITSRELDGGSLNCGFLYLGNTNVAVYLNAKVPSLTGLGYTYCTLGSAYANATQLLLYATAYLKITTLTVDSQASTETETITSVVGGNGSSVVSFLSEFEITIDYFNDTEITQ